MPVVNGASLTLNQKVSYRTFTWRELVVREWGTYWGVPEIVYEFSDGKVTQSTDQTTAGLYATTRHFALQISGAPADMAGSYILQTDGSHILID